MHQVRPPSHDNAAATSMTSSTHQQLHPRINNTLKISLADRPTSTAFTCQKKVKQSFGCHFFSIDFLECSVRAGGSRAGRVREERGGRGGAGAGREVGGNGTPSFHRFICEADNLQTTNTPAWEAPSGYSEMEWIASHYSSLQVSLEWICACKILLVFLIFYVICLDSLYSWFNEDTGQQHLYCILGILSSVVQERKLLEWSLPAQSLIHLFPVAVYWIVKIVLFAKVFSEHLTFLACTWQEYFLAPDGLFFSWYIINIHVYLK